MIVTATSLVTSPLVIANDDQSVSIRLLAAGAQVIVSDKLAGQALTDAIADGFVTVMPGYDPADFAQGNVDVLQAEVTSMLGYAAAHSGLLPY